jgi:hypothetical protein
MSSRLCVPSQTDNPLRLSPLFRDYWGEQMAAFTRRTDLFARAGCYVPRFFHAPDSETQFKGLAAGGYLTYLLSLPIGSFILGYLHTTSSAPNSNGGGVPPNASGFTCQITDLALDHKWFSRPAEEAYFVNDDFTTTAGPPYTASTHGVTFPSTPRLLTQPYPVVPPGQFVVEFWNALSSLNTDVQMTFLVMVPDGPDTNARRGSTK